jgi:hypothetical protein
MPLDLFVRQVRRWCATDIILAVLYIVYAVIQSGILSSMCWLLSCLYAMDGISLGFITDPKRVYTLSPNIFHGNTLLNVITLGVNLAYNALEIKHDGLKSPLLVMVAVFVIIYKTTKCLVIHKLAVRLIKERGDGGQDSFRQPLTAQGPTVVVHAVPIK